MKIYKRSQSFQMIQQNPTVQSDPNVQLQNLQNAQQALQYFSTLITVSEKVMADLRELEDTLGLGDIGLRTQIQDTINKAAMQTPAFTLLSQMNIVSSIDNLLDTNQAATINTTIIKNIQAIQSGTQTNQ